MVATIELEEIEIYAYHGCFEEEQRVGNRFVVNVWLDVEVSAAAETDDICDALNYVEVYDIVRSEMMVKSHLLEHVCARIVARIRECFAGKGLMGGRLKVSKMAPPVGGAMRAVSLTMPIAV